MTSGQFFSGASIGPVAVPQPPTEEVSVLSQNIVHEAQGKVGRVING